MDKKHGVTWDPRPIRDEKRGLWVFQSQRAPGDKGKQIKKKLKDWQLDDEGRPLPDLDPNAPDEENTTPRGSSSALATTMQSLSMHQPNTGINSYGDPPLDEASHQSSPYYQYSDSAQGYSYEDEGYGYGPPQETVPEPSGKGKGRASHPQSRSEGSRSSKHRAQHSRQGSHREPSPQASAANYNALPPFRKDQDVQSSGLSSGSTNPYTEEQIYSHHRNSTPRQRQNVSHQSLAPLPESGMLQRFDVDETQNEDGAFGQFGNEEGGPSTVSNMSAYAIAGPTSQSTAASNRQVPSIPSKVPRQDPGYRKHHAKEYKPGRILRLMWFEGRGVPTGAHESVLTDIEPVGPSEISRPSQVDPWKGYRMFIVVKTTKGHVAGVPIYTYQNQACCKPGCVPEHHGVIHEADQPCRMLEREPQLGFKPIRAIMTDGGRRLQYTSRVDYSKLVNIEMNLQVLVVGEVLEKDWKYVEYAVDHCWTAGNKDWGVAASGAWSKSGNRRRH